SPSPGTEDRRSQTPAKFQTELVVSMLVPNSYPATVTSLKIVPYVLPWTMPLALAPAVPQRRNPSKTLRLCISFR
ncbi:MAG TPA: hypothetical protein VK357_10460, partial [Rubrobacteraceae bacterium]|nr:hypothetical protein [Rubrobacteraceae bacterium]